MASKKDAPQGAQDAEPGFDQRLARLETLVAELEQGGQGLEQSLALYQEGVELLKGCRGQLAGYRKQVEELMDGAEGGLQPYPEDPDADELGDRP